MATLLDISQPHLHVPTTPFKNEPLTDFGNAEHARRMKAALSKVRAELGREYDMVIGEKLIRTTEKIKSVNPARPSEVVGVFQSAGREHVEPAIQSAQQAFETWKRTTVEQRASLLHTVAGMLRERKFEDARQQVALAFAESRVGESAPVTADDLVEAANIFLAMSDFDLSQKYFKLANPRSTC